jgi:hypothetical protein
MHEFTMFTIVVYFTRTLPGVPEFSKEQEEPIKPKQYIKGTIFGAGMQHHRARKPSIKQV